MAGLGLLFGCKGDGTLLDLYPMEPIVNPEVGKLIHDNRIVHARLGGRQRISGITENGTFITKDRFQSFDFESHPWQGASGPVGFGDGLIVHAPDDELSFSLRYSTDNGKTWLIYDEPIADAEDFAAGRIYVVQLLVSADHSVWLLCQQHAGAEQRTLFYRVDLEGGSSKLLFRKARAAALTIDFVDPESGWLLYAAQDEQDGHVHVLKTEDGGNVWSEGAMLNRVSNPTIVATAADILLIYDQTGTAYHSTDGGVSFATVTIGEGNIRECQAASANVVYALLTNGMAKSGNGGQTWEALNTQTHGIDISGTAMHFYSERQGILYSDDRLFLTENGGKSWDILVYPYDYVLE